MAVRKRLERRINASRFRRKRREAGARAAATRCGAAADAPRPS
jgi:hypothetical protein